MKAPSAIPALFLSVAALALSAAPALADPDCVGRDSNTSLTVQVTGMNNAKGEMAITVYPSDPKRFLAPRGKLLRVRLNTSAPMTQACFDLPGPGVYALAVYHDANGNRDFDRNAVGLPIEGFGFSNDAPTRFGLPSFDAVRFTAKPGDNLMKIKLRYVK